MNKDLIGKKYQFSAQDWTVIADDPDGRFVVVQNSRGETQCAIASLVRLAVGV